MNKNIKIIDCQQRSADWFRARAGLLTASNMGRLLTPKTQKPAAGQEEVIIELIASCVRPDEVVFEGNFHTDRGNALEPDARAEFAEIMGMKVQETGFIRSTQLPIGCSPDGLLGDSVETATCGLEIKCPLAKNHIKYFMSGVCPPQYLGQVHGSMIVTGLSQWYFMSYCPGFKPFITLVKRDGYTQRLEEEIVSFCGKYAEQYKKIIPTVTQQ